MPATDPQPDGFFARFAQRAQGIAPYNDALLFLCLSMYLGTGWSLVLFSFPVSSQLTTSNYYLQFVPQVQAATHFFTYMTSVMLVCTVLMLAAQWQTPLRWIPAIILACIVIATGLTIVLIFPLNDQMAGHITQPDVLVSVLARWKTLNWVRVGLWTVQWASLMVFYAVRSNNRGTT